MDLETHAMNLAADVYETHQDGENALALKALLNRLSHSEKTGQVSFVRQEEWPLLVSKTAENQLEEMAQLARHYALKHFGKSVLLYTPMYLSNYCINGCRYCSYGAEHDINRRALKEEEIVLETKAIAATGLRHILLLTGESENHFDFRAICRAIELIKPYFDSISIESYALSLEEYRALEALEIFGVTLYQETYNKERYEYLHPFGPKSDYEWRLDVPNRVGQSGIRQMNMGLLMGLTSWREDLLRLMAHGKYIQRKYPEMELSFSLPRMIPFEGSNFEALGISGITDSEFVQALCALRLVFPHCAINVSTRENKAMRTALLPIGVNKMSAGVSTEVGGHIPGAPGDGQFKISDESSVEAVRQMILENGYQPILRDWIKF